MMTKERVLIIAGMIVLAVVALIGWTRTEGTPPQTALEDPNTPVTDVPAYAESQAVRTISPAYSPTYPPERTYADRYDADSTRVVRERRPTSRSVEIVAGSAGAGAAIGAIAGGGRGAGIGAISGGAAGLIYDRMTHKRQEVESR